ncbi:MAG: hypothetical protein ACR2NR_01120 [Solirubrobacteraceae bacterium]
MSLGQPQRALQVTERDRRILSFTAEHRFVLAGHLAALLGVSPDAAGRRLRALRAAGYVDDDRRLQGEPPNYRVTSRGLGAIDCDLPCPHPPDLAKYRHEAGVAWLTVGAEHGMFGPLAEIVSERRMRSHDGRPSGRAEPFGVRLGGLGRNGRQRLHYPDLLLVTDTGHRVAFELELTSKDVRRRERILSAYVTERRIDAVVYLVDDPARCRAIERSVRRLGIADRVRVEGVSVGHRAGATSCTTAQRSARRSASALPDRGASAGERNASAGRPGPEAAA